MRHEYAQTAIDVIARRTRLSFLNAQAALNALPRVVDIMAEDLNWSLSRKRQELKKATAFLESMGLPSGAKIHGIEPRGLLERAESVLWWGINGDWIFGSGAGRGKGQSVMYSRAQFEAGEIDMLRAAFGQRAAVISPVNNARGTEGNNAVEELRLEKENVRALLKELPGYEGVHPKDFDYVLEAGLGKRSDMNFDEFVEVRALQFLFSSCGTGVLILWAGLRRHERSINRTRFRVKKGIQVVAKKDSGREEWRRCIEKPGDQKLDRYPSFVLSRSLSILALMDGINKYVTQNILIFENFWKTKNDSIY